ncbi:MAG: KH domain-containing protein [bacterium]|nr:KH domain-containing protein [bacterium]
MAAKNKDQDFVEFIVKSIVNNPDDVKVDRKVDEMGVLITLNVNPEDMGALIGREGSTARAIRTLTRIVGMKNNARVNLKIEEPEGGRRVERTEKKSVDRVVEDLEL